jgi:hypothetical protein
MNEKKKERIVNTPSFMNHSANDVNSNALDNSNVAHANSCQNFDFYATLSLIIFD